MLAKFRGEGGSEDEGAGLIYLDTLLSSAYLAFSASSMSKYLFSKAPLKGMSIAPGSFLSTHSLILINLKEIKLA